VSEPVIQSVPETQPQPAPEPPPEHHHFSVAGSLQWIGSVVVIAAFVMTFIVQAFVIPSESMENTLLIGDYLLVNKIDYAHGGFFSPLLPYTKIKRGDIVVFHYPVHPSQHFVKRVIGLPGDRIHLHDKQVFVNGQPLTEPYVIYQSPQINIYRDDFPTTKYIDGNVDSRWWIQMRKLIEDGNLIVPEGHYFVMGDNRDESLDSRYWGFVPRQDIVGRPLMIYFSMQRDEDNPLQTSQNAKLNRLANAFSEFWSSLRWHRMMKIVR
jgi:signal peptidase I